MYILCICELPDVVQDHLSEEGPAQVHQHQSGEGVPSFTIPCTVCGSIGCYADDTT